MKSKWRSRTVYIATIAAMSMMVAGFALASGLFAGFGAFSVSGNQGAITTTGTIYASGLSGSLYTTGSSGADGTCTAPSSSGTLTVTAVGWVAGGPGACAGATDYVLQLTFTATGLTADTTYTDSFVVSSEFGSATTYTASSVTIVCEPTEGPNAVCNAVINIDTGIATSAPQPNVDAVDVTVTGS